jgi:hypothetical protein
MNTLLDRVGLPQTQEGRRIDFTAKKSLRVLAASTIVLIGVLVVALASHPAAKDYISYWSAGKLLLRHADPYSPKLVYELEKTQRYTENRPILMRNPPWALPLVLPLGFGSSMTGLLLWTIAAAGCIIGFIRLLNVPPEDRVFAFTFAPAVCAFCSGQSSPFLLLGFSLFLRFHRSRPFLAGVSLALMAIKPHLFLVFWIVLLLDCLYRRRFLVLVGGAAALTVGTAVAMSLDHHVWQHYFAMLRGAVLDSEFFPTMSMQFRLLLDPKAVWLLFVPSVLGLVWGIWYYARNRHVWDWKIHGMLLILVTVMVSPYGWFSDEIVLLPALAFAAASPQKRKYSLKILMAINGIALLVLLVAQPSIVSRAYVWTPLAWFAWFLYATATVAKTEHLQRFDSALTVRS